MPVFLLLRKMATAIAMITTATTNTQPRMASTTGTTTFEELDAFGSTTVNQRNNYDSFVIIAMDQFSVIRVCMVHIILLSLIP